MAANTRPMRRAWAFGGCQVTAAVVCAAGGGGAATGAGGRDALLDEIRNVCLRASAARLAVFSRV